MILHLTIWEWNPFFATLALSYPFQVICSTQCKERIGFNFNGGHLSVFVYFLHPPFCVCVAVLYILNSLVPCVYLHLQAACDEEAEKYERAFILLLLGSANKKEVSHLIPFIIYFLNCNGIAVAKIESEGR